MASIEEINDRMSELDIDTEENEELCFDVGGEEESNKFDLCLVGRFLTEKTINVKAMRSKLADVWRPAMGVNIKELRMGLFLFQFYHKDDIMWVQKGGPWSFDGSVLVLNSIAAGEDPLKVSLVEVNFWIQIHDLPSGFMSEAVGMQLGNFFGTFMEYDPKNDSSIWRECMRIRIKVDVRKPLKRKKKIKGRNGSEFIVQCKYERLGDFCFSCGMISHTERFCQRKFAPQGGEISNEWGAWLRAPPRRAGGNGSSKWLREENDVEWASRYGKNNRMPDFSGTQNRGVVQVGDQSRIFREREVGNMTIQEGLRKSNDKAILMEGNSNTTSFLNGPRTEELDGLDIEERKRKRLGPVITDHMETEGGVLPLNDSDLSKLDCSESSNTTLATLAMQASRAL